MAHTFKKHKLTREERLWLEEAVKATKLDHRVIKIKLLGKIPIEFDGGKIDYRIWNNDALTLVGSWLMNAKDPVFAEMDRIIKDIQGRILKEPGIDVIAAKDLSSSTGIEEDRVEHCLYHLCGLGGFSSGSAGSSKGRWATCSLSLNGNTGYDSYLSYKDIWSAMERYYRERSPSRLGFPTPLIPSIARGPLSAEDYFDQPMVQSVIRPNTAFVLMAIDPTKPETEDIFEAIKDTCARFGVKANRADKVEHSGKITELILSQIATCELLIADLSYERPNVYYEVGYAQALKKNPILIRKKGERVHFDLLIHNVPEYLNATHLREILTRRLESVLGKKPKRR